jgi:hypothetical protein
MRTFFLAQIIVIQIQREVRESVMLETMTQRIGTAKTFPEKKRKKRMT